MAFGRKAVTKMTPTKAQSRLSAAVMIRNENDTHLNVEAIENLSKDTPPRHDQRGLVVRIGQ
jgi:hypothetical protein